MITIFSKQAFYLHFCSCLLLLQDKCTETLALSNTPKWNRREMLSKVSSTAFSILSIPTPSNADNDNPMNESVDMYHNRNRNKNKQAVIREDIWYMTGKIPPRRLDPNFKQDPGPEYNAWGACTTSTSTGNSCTYVPLSQRIPGYSNYAFSISFGANEYQTLGKVLQELYHLINASSDDDQILWEKADSFLRIPSSNVPPPAIDALLKMVLMGTSMLTTPNYSGPPKELLVARFYVNELNYAMSQMLIAIESRDIKQAIASWEFGRDSWNSYFVLINRSIVPKVGEPFIYIS